MSTLVFALGTLTLDRCVADGLVWFDRGELGRLRAAFATPDAAWVEKLRAAMVYAL
jgi:Zn-finger nucleic acid-binding protein